MASVVAVQTYDGARNAQFKLTLVSDGTEVVVQKIVDVTTLVPNPGIHMKLKRLRYNVDTMKVQLLWDATTPVLIALLSQGQDIMDFSREYAGGWPNNGGAGVTGSILLSTFGSIPNAGFTIDLEMIKGV